MPNTKMDDFLPLLQYLTENETKLKIFLSADEKMKDFRFALKGKKSSKTIFMSEGLQFLMKEYCIDAQICAIEEYAKRNDIIIVKTYIDRAKSATTADRPAFQEMIKMTETGLFDSIIIHKLDRFARSKYDSAIYKQKLKINKIRLFSVTENLDGTPESLILESVLEAMAEYYSKNLAREIMKGTMENAKKASHF